MTSVVSIAPEGSRKPKLRLPNVPWPDGTTWFSFRTWIALAIGLYAAFLLELQGASSTGICVLILAQPAQGMVLSKALYRFAGTIVGVSVAIALTALFPQDRTMLLASFAVFMALQTALGSALRDFRSYGCILAGYTVAIISIANIDTPLSVFDGAVNRVAAILVGIVAIALTNAVLATAESSRSLMSKLRAATQDVIDLTSKAIDERQAPEPSACIDLSARFMPLRSEISFALPEKANGRNRAKGARSALLGLFEMISAAQAVGAGLHVLDHKSDVVDRALVVAHQALHLQEPSSCIATLEALTVPAIEAGTLSIGEAFVLDRLHFMIDTLANLRDGLRSLRTGWAPARDVQIPVHQDWFAVVLNAVRVIVSIGIIAVLGVWSGLPDTATAILFTAVFVSLGGVQPDPSVMGKTALYGMPMVVLAGALYAFFLFPVLTGYPLFAIALIPLVTAMCWLIKIGMPGAGLIFGVQTLVLIAPDNVQTLDPTTFVSTATMLTASGVAIYLSFLLILPVNAAQRRLRIALGVGDALRSALADENKLEQPRASLHYDRLSQFKTWQRDAAPTLARRKTMKRLVDIGNLSLAVRRAWRGLDRAKACSDPELDRQARDALARLDPSAAFAAADGYLAQAHGSDRPARMLDLVHAAAALYGTAMVTRSEVRLLRRTELMRRAL